MEKVTREWDSNYLDYLCSLDKKGSIFPKETLDDIVAYDFSDEDNIFNNCHCFSDKEWDMIMNCTNIDSTYNLYERNPLCFKRTEH